MTSLVPDSLLATHGVQGTFVEQVRRTRATVQAGAGLVGEEQVLSRRHSGRSRGVQTSLG